jgi:hypothetical protein
MSVRKEAHGAHRDGVLGLCVSYWTAAVSHCLLPSTVRFRLLVAQDTCVCVCVRVCVCVAAESIHLATSPVSRDREPKFAA